ncbi:MAG TPA: hypothetical protein EYO76_12195 [Flavobacteriaceae bacterium]|nr:hypothetical protein [Flavobacteriaceae bacterium]
MFTCQKDDTSNDTEKSITIQEPKITTIENFGLTDSRFNSLKEALNLDVYLKSKSALAQSRTTQDTLGLTIATDIIKQVTLGDYTSYTMEVVQATDSTVFYNLTIEYKNGETGMFLTKYTPTQYWLDNTNESYQGEIETARINELTEYTDVDQMFDEDLVGGDNNTGLGSGVGGSNDNYTPQGSPYYPTDCGGTVIITMESIPYPCGCGDWPGGNCQGCNNSSPMFPGYTQVPYYTCIDYGYGNPVDGNTNTTS